MSIVKKSRWSLAILLATVACAIGEIIVDARQRRHARRQVVEQIHEWENEGGATPPLAEHS